MELTTTDRRDFKTLDGIVKKGVKTFVEVGVALAEIKERELWRVSFTSFADYCEQYGWSKTHAYRLIDSAKTAKSVSPIGETSASSVPENEGQARELSKAGDDAPRAWKKAQEIAAERGRPVTASICKEAVASVLSDGVPYDPFADLAEYEDDEEDEEAWDDWEQTAMDYDEIVRGVVVNLRNARSAMPKHGENPWVDDSIEGISGHINEAIKLAELCLSGGVCTDCDGAGCSSCYELGFVSKRGVM